MVLFSGQKRVMGQFEKVHAECAENIGLTLSELSGLSVKLTYGSKKG
jgi:hypothetical protein